MRQAIFDRARRAVLDELGWDDDRDTDGEAWDAAGDIVQAVVDELAATQHARAGRAALWRLTCARSSTTQGAPP